MAIYKNRSTIARILILETGEYLRVAPGDVTRNVSIDVTNPVIAAYIDSGDLVEVKPKPSKTAAKTSKAET